MKHSIKTIYDCVVSDNAEFIKENGGNAAEYILSNAENAEFGWFEFLTDEEIAEFESATSERREEIKDEIRAFVNENYDYNLLAENWKQEQILESAYDQGFKKIEITHAINSYPTNLGDYGVIGFETIDDAAEFAEKHGCELGLFSTKAGWHFWHHKGIRFANEGPFTAQDYVNDLGDNCMIANKADVIESFKGIAEQLINDFDGDFDALQTLIDKNQFILNDLDGLSPNETFIITDGDTEIIPSQMMKYTADTKTWAIGVWVPRDI